VGLGRQVREGDVVGQRHAAGVDLEDLFAADLVRHADFDPRSKRPGRRSAGSTESTRLVAAMTMT